MATSKLYVSIDKDVLQKLEKRADGLGFDSVQACIGFWAEAEVDGRWPDCLEDDWGQPTPEAAARLNRMAREVKERKNFAGPFFTLEEFMEDLNS